MTLPDDRPLSRITPLPLYASYVLVYGLMIVLLCFAVPRLEPVWADARIDLPASSKLALALSHWFRDGWGWLMMLPVPLIVPGALFAAGPKMHPAPLQRRRRIRIITSLVLMAMAMIFGLAVIQSYVAMLDAAANMRR